MATTLPADAAKANSDASTDDPKQALLTDLAGAVDMENALKAALGAAAQLNLGEGLEAVAQTDPTPNDLRVRLPAASGLLRTASGIALDIAALQKQSYAAIDDSGAADAVALTISPAIAAYAKYQAFMALIVATNTAATTVSVNGLGAKALKKWKVGAKVALEAGDLIAGMVAHMVYDGTDVILLNPPVGEDYIYIRDEKTSGTDAGTFTSGAKRTRTLNTIVVDTGGHATLAADRITLAAGTWRFAIRAPAHDCNGHQAFLENITDAATIAIGSTNYAVNGTGIMNDATVRGRFTISAAKDLEVQHRCATTQTTTGFGKSASFGTEVYAEIELWRER